MTQEVSACQHCGKSLPLRVETRGRKASFCSNACKSAAYRVRKQHQIETELAQARTQLSIDLRTDSKPKPGDLADWIDAFTDTLDDASRLTADEVAVVKAAQQLAERVHSSGNASVNAGEPHTFNARLIRFERHVADLEAQLESLFSSPNRPLNASRAHESVFSRETLSIRVPTVIET